MKRLHLIAAAALLGAPGCAPPGTPAPALPAAIPPLSGEQRTAFALRYIDASEGTGAAAEPHKCVYAHYTGWLTDGTKFDSSRDPAPDGTPRPPIGFPQGARHVIAGWDEGFVGMRVGGRRRLFIPYQLAYGESGRPPVIPARSDLIFDVELMALADPIGGQGCPPWEAVSRTAP